MTLPVLNLSLLNSLMHWAWSDFRDFRDGPSLGHWDQNSWFRTSDPQQGTCQSSYCIAGQAVAQVGFKMVLSPSSYDYSAPADVNGNHPVSEWLAYDCVQQVFDGLDDEGKPRYRPVGDNRSIPEVAREALGITDNEGSALFNGENSIERVLFLGTIIAASRGLSLSLPDEAAEMVKREVEQADERFYGFDVSDFVYGYEPSVQQRVKNVLFPPPPTCDTCGQVLPESDVADEPLADRERDMLGGGYDPDEPPF